VSPRHRSSVMKSISSLSLRPNQPRPSRLHPRRLVGHERPPRPAPRSLRNQTAEPSGSVMFKPGKPVACPVPFIATSTACHRTLSTPGWLACVIPSAELPRRLSVQLKSTVLALAPVAPSLGPSSRTDWPSITRRRLRASDQLRTRPKL
jgi:hypothetical protein